MKSLLAMLLALHACWSHAVLLPEGTLTNRDMIAYETSHESFCEEHIDPDATRVAFQAGKIVVDLFEDEDPLGNPPGCALQRAQLGKLPTGTYTLEIRYNEEIVETLSFDVVQAANAGAFDVSGTWWNPAQSGAGVYLHAGPGGVVVGGWLTFRQDGEPDWILIGAGGWTSPTEYHAPLHRIRRGPPTALGPTTPSDTGEVDDVGTLRAVFSPQTGAQGTFEFTLDGETTVRILERAL